MLGHAAFASLAAVLLLRALAQVWVDDTATDAVTSVVLRLAVPAFSAAASALAVAAALAADLFRRLSTRTASAFDGATHVFNTPLGPRAIQGYAIPLLLLPGWVAAGRFGAELVVAAFAALASVATALILRDTIASVRLRGVVWAMTTFLAPGVLLAFHIYPNLFGAAPVGFATR